MKIARKKPTVAGFRDGETARRRQARTERHRTVRPVFAVHKGTFRMTICLGPWALKVARNGNGRRCNRFEADLWARTSDARREMLCPPIVCLPLGLALLMQRAQPLSELEALRLRSMRGFPDWDYVPPDEGEPFEYKASDWGRLPDGRLVALDYSAPALN
jgi:hypothetical protein